MRGFDVTSHTRANTPLFGAGPKALTGLKGVFHWPKANLEWKTPLTGHGVTGNLLTAAK